MNQDMAVVSQCSFRGCNRGAVSRGWCKAHWQTWSRNGKPEVLFTDLTPLERLLRFVQKSEDCWVWTGYVEGGYGRLSFNGEQIMAHRFSFEIHKKKIPIGMQVDHLCCNTRCVNPEHLEAVTSKENICRSILRGRNPRANQTHCIHGHKFDSANTYIKPNGNRACKECAAQRRRAQ